MSNEEGTPNPLAAILIGATERKVARIIAENLAELVSGLTSETATETEAVKSKYVASMKAVMTERQNASSEDCLRFAAFLAYQALSKELVAIREAATRPESNDNSGIKY